MYSTIIIIIVGAVATGAISGACTLRLSLQNTVFVTLQRGMLTQILIAACV